MKVKPYRGVLVKPMTWHSDKERNNEQMFARLDALLEHFQIWKGDPDHMFHLACALAQVYVPGCKWAERGRKGRGKPTKWRGRKSQELYADVRLLLQERPKRTLMDACRILATTARFKARYGGDTPANLYRRYQEAPQSAGPIALSPDVPAIRLNQIDDDTVIRRFALNPKGGN